MGIGTQGAEAVGQGRIWKRRRGAEDEDDVVALAASGEAADAETGSGVVGRRPGG